MPEIKSKPPETGQAGQVFPTLKPRRWYERLFRRAPPSRKNRGSWSNPVSTSIFIAIIGLAVVSAGLIALGLRGGPGWTWAWGLAGAVIATALAWIALRSLERRLWGAFFSALAGAATSLAGPTIALQIKATGSATGAVSGAGAMSGTVSWGANGWTSVAWLAMALIAGSFAAQVRRS